jgi:hypothetical protein
MRASLRKILLLTLAPGAAIAQNSDLSLLFGPSHGMVRNSPNAQVSEDIGFANQYAFAWQVLDAKAGGLYVEIPFHFAGYSSANTRDGVARGGTNSYLFTPGLRFRFSLRSRLSFYLAGGGGVGVFGVKYIYYAGPNSGTISENHTASGLVDFGGGIDYRLTRLLSLRGEGRDFVSRRVLGPGSSRNLVVVGAGIGLHF